MWGTRSRRKKREDAWHELETQRYLSQTDAFTLVVQTKLGEWKYAALRHRNLLAARLLQHFGTIDQFNATTARAWLEEFEREPK